MLACRRWLHGQDVMATVKTMLRLMLPQVQVRRCRRRLHCRRATVGALSKRQKMLLAHRLLRLWQVFLDVDSLVSIAELEHYVWQSDVVLQHVENVIFGGPEPLLQQRCPRGRASSLKATD